MLKYKRQYIILIIVCVLLHSTTVFANNDGQPHDDPYQDGGYSSSYDSNVKYYDCLIPYAISYADFGGIAATDGYVTADSSYSDYSFWCAMSKQEELVGTKIVGENCHSTDVLKNTYLGYNNLSKYDGASISDIDGLCIAKDKNGAEYYIAATGAWTVKSNSNTDKGFKKTGQLFDVILTDGTAIHFVRGDAIGVGHSNGHDNTGQDGIYYGRSDSKYPQYECMFHCQGGQVIEIWYKDWNSISKFKEKYNIGSGKDNVQISCIRMYDADLGTAPKRVDGNGLDSKVGSGDIKGSSKDKNGDGLISEWEIEGMHKSPLSDDQQKVNFKSKDDLSTGEQYSLSQIAEGIDINSEVDALDLARKIVAFIGLVLVVYASIIFIAMIVDKTNTFIDIGVVKLVTFNLIDYRPNDIEITTGKYISTKKLVISTIIILCVGLLILSGSIFSGLSDFVWWFSQKFL